MENNRKPKKRKKSAIEKSDYIPTPSQMTKHKTNFKKSNNDEVRIYSLGGLGVVGMNMYCVESKNEIVIMDAGILFADDDDHGVNYIIPDFTYLEKNQKKIVGLFITHGHEDHIGAIPFLLQKVNIPAVYASGLAVGLIKNKMLEFSQVNMNLKEYKPDDVFKFNDFAVSFFRTNHSIPDSFGIAIKTKLGYVVNTGDFKFDFNPIGPKADYYKMTKLGEEGVYCLLSESTNADVPQFSESERTIGQTLESLFKQVEGRIIVATFASNVYRVQQILDASISCGRKVLVFGHSMEKTIDVASRLRYINVPKGWIYTSREVRKLKETDDKITILCTGSQGEPLAALSRIANGTHKQIKLKPNDTVIYSSKPIPGNEQFVNRNINKIVHIGAHVIKKSPLTDTHTTGHASQIELKMMMTFLKPKYFVPIHGEYSMLKKNVELACSIGIEKDNCFVLAPGDVLNCSSKGPRIIKNGVPASDIYLDNSLSDVDSTTLKERRILANDGLVSITYFINKNRVIYNIPVIDSSGFATPVTSGRIMNSIKQKSTDIYQNIINKQPHLPLATMEKHIANQMAQYIYQKMERKPLIAVTIKEV